MINTENREHLLNAVLEYCEDIVTVKDLSLRYVAYNKAFFNLVNGKQGESFIGRKLCEFLPFSCVEVLEKCSKKVIQTQEIQTVTFVLSHDNVNKIIKQTATPIVKNGKLEGILAVSTDVTNEECLKAKLIAKNYQLNTLLENLPILVYMKDKDRNLIVANEHSKNFVNKGIDYYADNLRINVNDASEETANEDNYVLQNKKNLNKIKSALDYEGKMHWYKINKAPILTENNDVMGIVTICKNIDKEKRLENQKNLFLATLSHDLKNPLQAQISSLELLNKGMFGELTSAQKEMVEMILESSKYMKEMLYSLLKSGKDNNGIIILNRSYFDLFKVVQKSVKETRDWALSKNVKIELTSSLTEKDKLFADEIQICRVIGNILNNGINYAYENSIVKIDLHRENDSIFFSITNKSDVIAQSLKEQIFDKYVCGEPLQRSNGIGLGLYFCRKVVEANEGNISLKSNGNNNSFIIELPILTDNHALINEIVL